MQFGDIVVSIDDSPTGRKRTEIALALAARSGARLIGYHLQARLPTANEAELEFERKIKTNNLEGAWVVGRGSHRIEDIAN
ncbi:MAG: hypothetical protein GY798_18770, partial [Hyphomicrobiales bacterium]|nr:hypothetical protein [Hyphomicrobiales bacterium]